MTLDTYAAGTGTIEQFGTNNPKVAAFLQASFALDGLNMQQAHGSDIKMQSISAVADLVKGGGISF